MTTKITTVKMEAPLNLDTYLAVHTVLYWTGHVVHCNVHIFFFQSVYINVAGKKISKYNH